jgi:ABC-type transport system substrate-binding protein
MRKFIVVYILLVILAIISSCLLGFAEETKEKVFTYARNETIEVLDPYNNYKCSNQIMDYLIYDRLMDDNPEARLATEVSVSPDGKEYTLTLRKGVKFHNGEPFNAECVKVSLERFQKENLVNSTYWATLKEVEIVDDYKVIIRFNEPNVSFLGTPYLRTTAMLPAKAFTEQGPDLFFKHPIGTGAFTFESFIPERNLIVKKNPEYWGKTAYVDKFIYISIAEDSTRIAGLHTGEIDLADTIPVDQIPSIEADPNLEVLRVPAWGSVMLALKCDKPPFTDIKFRQAVNLAIDRESIVKYVIKTGKPLGGCLMEGMIGFDPSLPPIKRDIEKAKQLVKESIYDGREIVILSRDGVVPKNKDVLQAIQAQLIEAGINAKLEILEAGAFTEKRAAGEYDMFLTLGVFSDDMSEFFIYRIIHADTVKIGYVNEELNGLIVKETQEANKGKRIELFRKIENIMNAEVAPWLYLYQIEQVFAKRKGVTGGTYYYDSSPDLRYVHYEE